MNKINKIMSYLMIILISVMVAKIYSAAKIQPPEEEQPAAVEQKAEEALSPDDQLLHSTLPDYDDKTSIKMAREALKAKADINTKEPELGSTPLLLAIGNNKVPLVEFLLKNKADFNERNNQDHTALITAAFVGNSDIVNMLLKHKAYVDEGGVRINATPLMVAAMAGHPDIIEILLKNRANIDAVDSNGNRVLSHAVRSDNPGVVNLLLDRGAAIDATNNNNDTPLLIAAKENKGNAVEALLKRDAEADENFLKEINEKGREEAKKGYERFQQYRKDVRKEVLKVPEIAALPPGIGPSAELEGLIEKYI